ncbi:hypothetical protein HWV62_34683 [Athelia sp. TMB]|nr:hypothetical protein HWV62_34683 [Athelia sp. TMB]
MQLFMTSLFSIFFALFSVLSFVSSAPLNLDTRDVYTPPVTYPKSGTVWKVGSKYNVTWYDHYSPPNHYLISHQSHCIRATSNPPTQITNKEGEIYLRHADTTSDTALASGFDILKGHQEITVPQEVSPGTNYRVVREYCQLI